jgi:hypothetical protein
MNKNCFSARHPHLASKTKLWQTLCHPERNEADSLANRFMKPKDPYTGGIMRRFLGVLVKIVELKVRCEVETPLSGSDTVSECEVPRLRPLIRKQISGLRSG